MKSEKITITFTYEELKQLYNSVSADEYVKSKLPADFLVERSIDLNFISSLNHMLYSKLFSYEIKNHIL